MQKFLLLLFLSVSINSFASDDFPTNEEVISWVAKTTYDKINIYNKDKSTTKTIYLQNHEKAYLIPVSTEAGRNGFFQTVLARPALQEARLMKDTIIQNVDATYDLDNDRVYEIVVHNSASGQGDEFSHKAIIQLNGWEPVILHERDEKTIGFWGEKDKRYFQQTYFWEFIDLNNDGILDLKETSTIRKGRDNLPPITTSKINIYVFLNGKFSEIKVSK